MDTNELLGRIVDRRYRINELIGSGGMGAVYRATHLEMNREIALKVLGRGIADSDKQIHRFYQEARASSRLQHPNTIRVFDFGRTEDGRLYLAMEYLRGESLGDLVKREKGLDIDRCCHIARQICKSLAEAHQNGIVHRDLKPDNIFITDIHGEQDFVKVLDFGIAKSSESEDMASLTQTGFICGTPRYLSPEQALGQPVDARSDLYSLGVILFEMLTGSPPFVASTPIALVMKHIHESAPDMPSDGTQQGDWMRQLIGRLLEKQPSARPPSAPSVSDVLKAIEANREPEMIGSEYVPSPPARNPSTPTSGQTLNFRANRPISGHGAAAAQASAALSTNETVMLSSDELLPQAPVVTEEPMARETFDQAVLHKKNPSESDPTMMVQQADLSTDPDGVEDSDAFEGGRTLALDTQPNAGEKKDDALSVAKPKSRQMARKKKGAVSSTVSVNLDEENEADAPFTQMIEVSSRDSEDELLAKRVIQAGRTQNIVFGTVMLLLLSTIGLWVWLGGQGLDVKAEKTKDTDPQTTEKQSEAIEVAPTTPETIRPATKEPSVVPSGETDERAAHKAADRQDPRTRENQAAPAPPVKTVDAPPEPKKPAQAEAKPPPPPEKPKAAVPVEAASKKAIDVVAEPTAKAPSSWAPVEEKPAAKSTKPVAIPRASPAKAKTATLKPKPRLKPKAKAKPRAKPKAKAKAKPRAKPKAKAKAKTKVKRKAKPKAKTKRRTKRTKPSFDIF